MSALIDNTIILIGPACTGKTTLANIVAGQLERKHVSLDNVAKSYYLDFGFTKKDFSLIEESEGYLQAYKKWEPARVYAVKRVLAEQAGAVIDFGAGHSHYLNKEHTKEVQILLKPFSNIFLILPSEQSGALTILRNRNLAIRKKDWVFEGYDLLLHWIIDSDNYQLAKKIVYTREKPLFKVANEIIAETNLQ